MKWLADAGLAGAGGLLPYALLAVSLCLVVALYGRLKQELAVQTKRNRRMEAMLLRLRDTAARDKTPSGPAPPQESNPSLPEPARSGMNLTRRLQVLRLQSNGEAPERIAAALGVPRKE